MKKVLFLILLSVIATASSWFDIVNTLPKDLEVKADSPEGLKKIIDRGDPRFVIVDVRSRFDYKEGHIPTAINISGGITSNMKNPPEKDKYIIIYCNVGIGSRFAARRMLDDGYKYVLYWGGITNWPYKLEISQ